MAHRYDPDVHLEADDPRQDRSTLETIYRRHCNAVRRYVARHFGMGPPDPEDVVHAAFEKLAQIDNVARLDNPYTFLVRCTRNYVIDQRRRAKVRNEYLESQLPIESENDDLDAERVISSRERYEILAGVIGTLDPRRREMLLMNRVEGLSFAEIARQKGCSASLVKLLVADALAACHEALDRDEEC